MALVHLHLSRARREGPFHSPTSPRCCSGRARFSTPRSVGARWNLGESGSPRGPRRGEGPLPRRPARGLFLVRADRPTLRPAAKDPGRDPSSRTASTRFCSVSYQGDYLVAPTHRAVVVELFSLPPGGEAIRRPGVDNSDSERDARCNVGSRRRCVHGRTKVRTVPDAIPVRARPAGAAPSCGVGPRVRLRGAPLVPASVWGESSHEGEAPR